MMNLKNRLVTFRPVKDFGLRYSSALHLGCEKWGQWGARLRRMASAAASVRLAQPFLARMLRTCVATVFCRDRAD